jgi:hypothetical protein
MGMNITDALLIFAGGFASVFTLGFQSRAVNAGNYFLAAIMSFVVAMSQAHLWYLIIEGDGSLEASLVYGASGMVAITSAMFVHQKFFAQRQENT